MYRIVRWLEIDAGHRVLNHEGKCAHPHGHRYKIGFELESRGLDDVGRVLDFGFIKEVWGKWLDRYLDHGFIFTKADKLADAMIFADPGAKVYVMDEPATAEGIARHLWNHFFQDARNMNSLLRAVHVYETPNCCGSFVWSIQD